MLGRSKPGYPPLSPLGGGAIPWASACDFLGSPCPRRQIQGWCLEGDEEVFDDVYDEYGGIEELIKLLNHLDELLNILSIKLPYDAKIAEVQKFLSDLDNFRIQCSRYIGRVADLLYKDVKEIINEVFSGEVEGGVIEDG
jgi:hypothetical protein